MYHREILDTRILNSGITMEPWALVEREDVQLTTVLDVIKFLTIFIHITILCLGNHRIDILHYIFLTGLGM